MSMSSAATTPSVSPQPRSWSESLQQYQQQKHAVPALPHAPPHRYLPTSHPLHTDAIHTINGQYKRRQREDSVRAAEAAAEVRRVQRLQHIPTRAYNIVNNQSTAAQPRADSATSDTSSSANSTADSSPANRREYDIINNHLYHADSEARLRGEEQLQLQRLHNHAAVKLRREHRDYNNITHQYHSHHDEKQQTDTSNNTTELQRKYFSTHHYDPVQGQYCDPSKEVEWRQRKGEEEQKWAGRRAGGQTDVGQLISGSQQ